MCRPIMFPYTLGPGAHQGGEGFSPCNSQVQGPLGNVEAVVAALGKYLCEGHQGFSCPVPEHISIIHMHQKFHYIVNSLVNCRCSEECVL